MLRHRPWLPAALLLGLLLMLYGGQAFLQPLSLQLGSGASEGPIHLWSLWVTAEKLFSHGPLVRLAPDVAFPDGFEVHLMDPVCLLLFLPGYWLGGGGLVGASLGWNLLHAGALLVAGLGCYRLARVLEPEPDRAAWTAALLVAAVVGSSFTLSHPFFGRTEYLPLLLMPWHLALLLPWVRGDAGWKTGLSAGVLLGLVALGGGYAASFALLLELPLGAWLLIGSQQRRSTIARLGLVAGVALLVALPAPLALLAYPPASFGSLVEPTEFPVPPLRLVELGCALRASHPGGHALLMDQPVYPGVALLVLAIVGAVARPRQALGWLLIGLWLLLLSLGRSLDISPEHRFSLPASWLVGLLPPLSYIKFWSRLGVLLPVPLAIAACSGAAALLGHGRVGPRLRPVLGIGLVSLVLADTATWPRAWSERPRFTAALPVDLDAVLGQLPQGGVMQLPLEVPTGEGQLLETGFGILWQRQHRRPVTATPAEHGDQSLRSSNIARFALNLQAGAMEESEAAVPGWDGVIGEEHSACLRAEAAELATQGISALLVHEDRPSGPALAQAMSLALGTPSVALGQIQAWNLVTVPSDGGAPCPLFELASQVAPKVAGLETGGYPDMLVVAMTDHEGAPPRLDALAAEGTRLLAAFRNSPALDHALLSALSGQLPPASGEPVHPWQPGTPAPLLASLEDAGYSTAVSWGPGWSERIGRQLDFGVSFDERHPEFLEWLRGEAQSPWFALATLGALEAEGHSDPAAQLSELLDTIERREAESSTMLVVLSAADHRALPAVEALRDAALDVELVIIDPELPAGVELAPAMQLMDLAPTLFERASQPIPQDLLGRSLVPMLRGEASAHRPPTVAVAQGGVALRTPDHKLILGEGPPQVFDLRADPEERHDLAAGDPELAERLQAQRRGRLVATTPAGEAPHRPGVNEPSQAPPPGIDPGTGLPHPRPPEGGAHAPPEDPLERLAALESERAEVLAALERAQADGDAEQQDALRKQLNGIDIRLRPLLRIREGGQPGAPAEIEGIHGR